MKERSLVFTLIKTMHHTSLIHHKAFMHLQTSNPPFSTHTQTDIQGTSLISTHMEKSRGPQKGSAKHSNNHYKKESILSLRNFITSFGISLKDTDLLFPSCKELDNLNYEKDKAIIYLKNNERNSIFSNFKIYICKGDAHTKKHT